jgi:hypothetical protein
MKVPVKVSRGGTLLSLSYNKKGGLQLHKDSHGDIVANTLEYYRERTRNNDSKVPKPYQEISKRLQNTVDNGKRVLVDIKDSYSVQTIVVRFEYVHDRWAMGKSICYLEGREVAVPYTIHFSDIYCKKMKIKVITEGDNPFEGR